MTTLSIVPPDGSLSAFGSGYYLLGEADSAPAETYQASIDIEPIRGDAQVLIVGAISGPLRTNTIPEGGRSDVVLGGFAVPTPQSITVQVRSTSPTGIALVYAATLVGDGGAAIATSSPAPFEVVVEGAASQNSGPTTLALDASGDLAIEDGRFVIAAGRAAVAQNIRTKLGVERGEYIFDESLGVPYIGLLGSGFELSRVRAEMTAVISQVEGVDAIQDFDLSFDPTTRRITGTCRVSLSTGDVISVALPTEDDAVVDLDPSVKSFLQVSDGTASGEGVRVGFVNNEAFDYRTDNALLRADGWDANTLFGLSNSPGTPTVFSLSFWLYQVGTPPNQGFQSANNAHFAIGDPFAGSGAREISLYVLPRNVGANYQMAFGVANSGTGGDVFVLPTIVMPTVNAWHQYMLVYDGSAATTAERLRVWVDGVEATVTVQFGAALDPNIPQSTQPFTIGASSAAAVSGPQQGAVKNIGVYSSALAGANALEHFNGGDGIDLRAATGAADLAAYWRCSPGLGDSVARVFDRVGSRDLVSIGASNFGEV